MKIYVVRDANGKLFAYNDKPKKEDGYWHERDVLDYRMLLDRKDPNFSCVKWEDAEPTECKLVPVGKRKDDDKAAQATATAENPCTMDALLVLSMLKDIESRFSSLGGVRTNVKDIELVEKDGKWNVLFTLE